MHMFLNLGRRRNSPNSEMIEVRDVKEGAYNGSAVVANEITQKQNNVHKFLSAEDGISSDDIRCLFEFRYSIDELLNFPHRFMFNLDLKYLASIIWNSIKESIAAVNEITQFVANVFLEVAINEVCNERICHEDDERKRILKLYLFRIFYGFGICSHLRPL